MATPAYSSHAQTRQELDELDSLLQRMLKSPMSSAEPAVSAKPSVAAMSPEAFAPLPPNIKMFPPRSASSEPLVHAWRMEVPSVPTATVAVPSASRSVVPPAPYPYSMVFGQSLPMEAAPPPVEPLNVALPRSSPGAAVPFYQPTASAAAPRSHSLFLFPLVALNRIFDLLSYLLGPLGTWLRHPAGRSAMGWLGIVMIIGALGWGLADWFGVDWTH